MSDLLQQGIAAFKLGDKALARRLLGRAIQENPQSEEAWLWLSGAVESDKERLMCLNKVLAINPDNETARWKADALKKKPRRPTHTEIAQPPTPPVAERSKFVPQPPPAVDHSLGLDALSPEKLKALKNYTQLVAHDLIHGRSQRQVVWQLTQRGFPKKAVKQFVDEVARVIKNSRGT